MNPRKSIHRIGRRSQLLLPEQYTAQGVVLPETLCVWYQKYLDKQNPVKVQQLSDQERIKQLERENKELQRANEILRKAAVFFAQAELC